MSAPHKMPDDDYVMSFAKWCEVNGFSSSTGLRICRSGNGPRFIWLSKGRKGVTRGENRRWQESRATAEEKKRGEAA